MMLSCTDPRAELELLVVKLRERALLKQCRIRKNIRKSQADFLITTGAKHRHLRRSVRVTTERCQRFTHCGVTGNTGPSDRNHIKIPILLVSS